jgi:uncharacterized membrane protein
MSNQHTTVQAKSGNNELTLSQHSTDSPILPIVQIERLHTIRPDKVDWVFDQTQKEAEARREQAARINNYIFYERVIGQVFGLIIGLAGLFAAAYIAVNGSPTAGAVVGGATLASMVGAFIVGRSNGKPPVHSDEEENRPVKQKPKK